MLSFFKKEEEEYILYFTWHFLLNAKLTKSVNARGSPPTFCVV